MRVLVIDVGGTHLKVLATGHKKPVKIPSGPHMTAAKIVAAVRAATVTWIYHAVSIGSCFGRWQRRLLKKLLPGPRLRNNTNAFKGRYRLWTKAYGGSTHERFVHEEKKTDQFLAIVRLGSVCRKPKGNLT